MSNIEWTGDTWNPIVGCSRISDGCKNCYAETMTKRLAAMGLPKYQGLLNEQGRFNGETRFDEDALLRPLKRKKPTTYFVNSMSDLFHGSIPDEWIDAGRTLTGHAQSQCRKCFGAGREFMFDNNGRTLGVIGQCDHQGERRIA